MKKYKTIDWPEDRRVNYVKSFFRSNIWSNNLKKQNKNEIIEDLKDVILFLNEGKIKKGDNNV